MRILVVFAHPLETSFVSALHARVVEILRAGGHMVDDLDLYAEKFDPVMSREQFAHYVDTSVNTREVEPYVDAPAGSRSAGARVSGVVRRPARDHAGIFPARVSARRRRCASTMRACSTPT